MKWEEIKTFEDACDALGIDSSFGLNGAVTKYGFRKHLTALYKLDIIRQALNQGWEPSLTNGNIYLPYVELCDSYNALDAQKMVGMSICAKLEIEGENYYLVGNSCDVYYYGACDYKPCLGIREGSIRLDLGLLGCKSNEIAQHMSRYFAKEIFEAAYSQYNSYIWK